MLLILLGVLLAALFLYMGMKLYFSIDWNEPAEPGPDLRAMRQREAELLRIQEIMEEAHQAGKLSRRVVEEFNRFCEAEFSALEALRSHHKHPAQLRSK